MATYRTTGTNSLPALMPAMLWNADGSIREKAVSLNHKTVFSHQFQPAGGGLYLFGRQDYETGEYRLEYFDRSSSRVGVISVYDNPRREQYEWKGKNTDSATFSERVNALHREK